MYTFHSLSGSTSKHVERLWAVPVNQRHIFRRQFCARGFESPKHVSRGDIYFLESIAPTIKPTIAPGIIPDMPPPKPTIPIDDPMKAPITAKIIGTMISP